MLILSPTEQIRDITSESLGTEITVAAPVTRTARSARNIGMSLITQMVIILLSFVTRSVFVAKLGVDFLGMNSVLTSIVAMLALADLGINGAVLFALYKPLRDGDTAKTAAIVAYAGRLFTWVAFAVAVVGVGLVPFIERFVRLNEDVPLLEVYYLVLLANIVVNYLMLNRKLLFNADQKIYLIKAYSLAFTIFRSLAQIASLLIFQSFLLYLAIQVFFTISNNLAVYLRAGKLYPYIKKTVEKLSSEERKSMLSSVRAMLLYRIGDSVLANSPPLLISVIVGTTALGYYSSYMLIIAAAVMISESIFSAVAPSVGNLVAGNDPAATRRTFDEIGMLSVIIHGMIAVSGLVLIDNFVVLWLGEEFVLPFSILVAIIFSFYLNGTMVALQSFRNATGLFRQTRFMILLTAVLSIPLAILLGEWIGMLGVVVAPAIARLFTGAWYEPWKLIRNYLSGRVFSYFSFQILSFLLWVVVAMSIKITLQYFSLGALESLGIGMLILAGILPLSIWCAFGRSQAFKSLFSRAKGLIIRPKTD